MHRARQDEVELEKSVRRLREKFYGKVSIKTATVLMRQFCNNHELACSRIILCKNELEDTDPEDGESLDDDPVALRVVDKLEQEEEQKKQKRNDKSDEKIKEVAQQLKCLPLTQKNLRMFDNAEKNRIPPEDRQFSCQPCDSMWWRRVPKRKQVSRCHLCGNKYDPVPEDKMWGTAEFTCPSCGRTFSGSAQMGTPSPCYSCHSPVLPSFIIPPRKKLGPRSRQQHSCFAEDCYNRREPHIPGTHCVHPQSRVKNSLPKVIYPSQEHDSTGSTVATCLSQGSLAFCDINELILEDLKEEEAGESSN
ncbi:shiftless antiviral inhibitor of ribosomal frameshifting protein isoform X1 [Podarcis raffonei]|uniref:Shiftless antiviral inhibitor of ribosomal frameshifting n=2 Tax=Podarcis muralis TaxID=64176 RepID=A0A670KKB3_PODMU|nr:repressor of yield of DENV protein isoform X1 [Podarcis muralis]XP_053226483.1 shiftless antiviral inhibitor of ribosomal frameshifting protein isoform X1 [Podarcis raffonei]